MLHVHTLAVVTVVNLALFGALLQLSGSLLPEALKGYYASTVPWQRAIIGGAIYALVVIPFNAEFARNPGIAGMTQAIFNALFILMMVVVVGGKPLSLHIGAAAILLAAAGIYLAWAVSQP